jgi:23S rRNA pseudouridine1911/1915/1917 synthase
MTLVQSGKARQFTVTSMDGRLRLDRFLVRHAPEFSRARIQSFIRNGLVKLNEAAPRPSDTVRIGDRVVLIEPPVKSLDLQAEAIALSVLFEDGDLVVINKPAGISVHPGAGRNSGTLVNALLAHCRNLSGIGGKQRPGIVHRLDKGTSGCLLVAKNDAAHLDLSRQFAARTVEKIYLALVAGKLRRNSGSINAAIGRHRVHRTKMAIAREGGREARTDFQVVRSGVAATLLKCRLHSGRTHQIRVHLQHIGHPILGDREYGGARTGNFPRPMLHAWKLAFDHPRTKARMHFEADVPADFESAMRELLP